MALERIESSLTLDIYNHNSTSDVIYAISGDSKVRYVIVTLTNNGSIYIPEATATAELLALRPDGALIIGDALCETTVIPSRTVTPEETTYTDYDDNGNPIEVTTYYYIDNDGNTVYVETSDDVVIPESSSFSITAELNEEMLSVIGTLVGQLRITDGDQILLTDTFNVSVAIDISKTASSVIDLRT